MGSSLGTLLVVQVVLIALNAVFASAEIAVLSVNEQKLERMASQGNKKAKRLYKLTREPARFLSTIQIAITLSGFLSSAFAADGFSGPLVNWMIGIGIKIPRETLETIAVILITLILSYFSLVFGELVPKRIAMKKSEELSLAISGLISGISVVFKPIVGLLSVSTNAVLRLCGIDPTDEDDEVSEESIRLMVEAGGEKGAIDPAEQTFIQNVFEFDDISAGEIATHRTDVVALWLEESNEEWDKIIHENRFTFYPVCDGSADNIVGILDTRDYFRLRDKSRSSVMKHAVDAPYFIPDSKKADELFHDMKAAHQSLVVALDEYGGMVGIVTMNDLIEELLGKIDHEPESQASRQPQIEKTGEKTWKITGNISLEEISNETGASFDDRGFETFTGLVFDALGKILPDGKQDTKLTLSPFTVTVQLVEKHQVESAILCMDEEATSPQSDSEA